MPLTGVMGRLCKNGSRLSRSIGLVLSLNPAGRAPLLQNSVHVVEYEETCAFQIVAVIEQDVIIRQPVPDIGRQGEPSGRLGRRRMKTSASQGVIHHRFEFMSRDARGEDPNGALDGLTPVHDGYTATGALMAGCGS